MAGIADFVQICKSERKSPLCTRLDAEHTAHILVGVAADVLLADLIGIGQTGDDVADESRLVALSPHRDGSHVGGVGLQNDAVEGDGGL